MLCTAINELAGEQVAPYRSTHKNHPSTKWVRASSANFESLAMHTFSMLEEYTERFNKIHKCAAVLNKCLELYDPSLFPSNLSTQLPLAMPPQFRSDNPILSYRKFYASKPRIRYPKGKIPDWFREYRADKPFEII